MGTHSKPLLGFRRWAMNWRCELSAAVSGHPWVKGLNKAYCDDVYSHHEAPGETCHCGFNAWFSLSDAKKHYSDSEILGAIAGAGDTRIHSKGFRCSEAQIIALLVPADFDRAIEKLEKDYGVPVFIDEKEFLRFVKTFDLIKKKDIGRTKIGIYLRLEDCLYFLKAIGIVSGLVFGVYYFLVAGILFIAPESEWKISDTILTVVISSLISILFSGYLVAFAEKNGWLHEERFTFSLVTFCSSFVVAFLLSILVVIPTFKPENAFSQQVIEKRTEALNTIAEEQEEAYQNQGYFWGEVNSSLRDHFLLTDDQKEYGFKEEDYDLSLPRGQQSYSLTVRIPEDKNDRDMNGTMTLKANSEGQKITCEPEKACE